MNKVEELVRTVRQAPREFAVAGVAASVLAYGFATDPHGVLGLDNDERLRAGARALGQFATDTIHAAADGPHFEYDYGLAPDQGSLSAMSYCKSAHRDETHQVTVTFGDTDEVNDDPDVLARNAIAIELIKQDKLRKQTLTYTMNRSWGTWSLFVRQQNYVPPEEFISAYGTETPAQQLSDAAVVGDVVPTLREGLTAATNVGCSR